MKIDIRPDMSVDVNEKNDCQRRVERWNNVESTNYINIEWWY